VENGAPKHIKWEIRERIGILTIGDPPGNYMGDPEVIPVEWLKRWIEQGRTKGLVICGTGRNFSGGADMKQLFDLARKNGKLEERISAGKNMLKFISELEIPVVAAIKGICFGGGLELALSCHIRLCGENALFAFPETNHSMMPGLNGILLMRGRASRLNTMALALGGDMVNAQEAQELGIVDRIIGEDVADHAFRMLKKMTADRSLKVIRSVMKALHNAEKLSFEEAMKEETRMFCELAKEEAARRTIEN
jgi:enoyl-CoA hydratase